MHPLLERQLRKAFQGGVRDETGVEKLLGFVDAAYAAADEDRRQLERSIHLASDELFERNKRLESELEERKRLESELELAEKLRAVGQLAAGIAHEINTPIQFIGDSLHFLRDAFSDIDALLALWDEVSAAPAPDEAALRAIAEHEREVDLAYLRAEIPRAIARSFEGTERVATIVRAMKIFAHPDAEEQALEDLNAAITNTLVVAANELRYVADVRLDLQATSRVVCHVGEIQQVLLNLLVNAAHAIAERAGESGQRGTIEISTRDDEDHFWVAISDDGSGIPDDVRRRIFEPFFTTKPVGKGTGQGLSIARTLIVGRHGGQLKFDSAVGVGTTFTVRLPLAGKARAESATLPNSKRRAAV